MIDLIGTLTCTYTERRRRKKCEPRRPFFFFIFPFISLVFAVFIPLSHTPNPGGVLRFCLVPPDRRRKGNGERMGTLVFV
ncbi:hypothetical protein SODALDRAFT_76447 [Sodiomyces alkalinus F11]|uniref:Uncharacterized protein n=1 Tax=Sodiomyces alkalinus (strain CBS 110278 / VKM F-3762 / F11) TaxID=1314773 RepID=A0A3N2PKI2_SODAK|nr:hypothetical protein SODALDRAFT_76447 [Sodiomyces alkalinus F11]ROT35015.1 hypothetical protein SODALDRAFT_76447 [Sodiomyces alkalinus F11]